MNRPKMNNLNDPWEDQATMNNYNQLATSKQALISGRCHCVAGGVFEAGRTVTFEVCVSICSTTRHFKYLPRRVRQIACTHTQSAMQHIALALHLAAHIIQHTTLPCNITLQHAATPH